MKPVIISNLSHNYDSLPYPVFRDIDLQLYPGWTGVAGPNGSGKTTFLSLCTGGLDIQTGTITGGGDSLYCSQRTDDPPEGFEDFLYAFDSDSCRLSGILGIETDWLYRWETLSFGERKRAQLGTALWRNPELLAIDEPTNHLDGYARKMIFNALKSYKGIGLLVSHDRMFLDDLCTHILFLDYGGWSYRSGNYSEGKEEERREQGELKKKKENIRKELKRIEAEQVKRRACAEAQQRRRSKRGIAIKDNDARFKKNLARISGKDGTGGKLLRQLDGRIARMEKKNEAISYKKDTDLGITLTGSVYKGDSLFFLEEGEMPLGDGRSLSWPSLELLPGGRVSVTGNNGAGKTTLIRKILNENESLREKAVYLPQELSSGDCVQLAAKVASLNREELGQLMSEIKRLGSEPEGVMTSAVPSPGEARKIMIAFALQEASPLLILDEPTNHLDLPSIECLEGALAGFQGALLIVSHDRRFSERLTREEWVLAGRDSGDPHTVYLSVSRR